MTPVIHVPNLWVPSLNKFVLWFPRKQCQGFLVSGRWEGHLDLPGTQIHQDGYPNMFIAITMTRDQESETNLQETVKMRA